MSKKETVKDAIDRMANVEVPKLMAQVVSDDTIDITERVTLIGLLDSVLRHLKLLQMRLE